MQGTVTKIWENEAGNGKRYWVLEVGDERYSVWKHELVDDLGEGDRIQYEWRNSGDYKKITRLSRCEGEQLPATQTNKKPDKDDRIIRMSCLRSAADILSGFLYGPPEEKAEQALNIAKTFEKYVRKDLDE